MKKIINFRPIFYCFIAFLSALLFAEKIFAGSISYLIFFFAIVLSFCFFAIKSKKIWQVSILLIAFAMGFLSFNLSLKKFDNAPTLQGQSTIQGRIIAISKGTYSQTVILSNVKINDELVPNVILKVSFGELEIGDKITFETSLEKVDLFNLGEFNSTANFYNTKYTSTIVYEDILNFEKTPLTLAETIKNTIYNLLINNMSQESANLAYSSLFGDKSSLDSDLYTIFKDSGVAHILAVSGMHVAFVVLFLNYILKKLKINEKIRLVIFTLSLLFYAYLCSFNPTVVRASIMSLIFISSTCFKKQYDSLTSLAISGFIILAINPLSAYSIGFQLSFLCAFIIIAFVRPFTNLLTSVHIPKSIATPFALTVCVQAGILPLSAKYFGSFSILSVITNLLIIPFFSVAFILTLLFIIISLILPFLSFTLTFVSFVYSLVIFIATIMTSVPFNVVKLFDVSNITITLFYLSLFVLSGYVMLKFKYKLYAFLSLILICFCLLAIETLPAKFQNLTIMQIQTTQTLIINSKNENFLIGDFNDVEITTTFLKRAKINKIDYIITNTDSSKIISFASQFQTMQIFSLNEEVILSNFQVTQIQLSTVFVKQISVDGHEILYLNDVLTTYQKELLDFALYEKNINIIINTSMQEYEKDADFIVSSNKLILPNKIYYDLKNWLFEIKHGKLERIGNIS